VASGSARGRESTLRELAGAILHGVEDPLLMGHREDETETSRYLLLSWRMRPPYLAYSTVCALVSLGLLVFNLVQGFKRNWHLPTWQHHPLEEATELALCGALVVEVVLTHRLLGTQAFLANSWCVFDAGVAGLSVVSMLYALTHLGSDGELAQASLPLLVLRFFLQPLRVCALVNQTLQARSLRDLEAVDFTSRPEELLGESARVSASLRSVAEYEAHYDRTV
jgi:hypothetical protein